MPAKRQTYRSHLSGNYGGTCLRGDDSLVVKKRDIEPLIVVKDN
ncbi:MAG: hypothetical protein ACLR9W_10420 [Enterobacter hormaechei]